MGDVKAKVGNREIHGCPAAKVAKVAGLVILGIIGAAVLAIVFGLVIQWLWNQLMPGIFGLPEVSYWQAVGLVVLSHILFGAHGHTTKYHKKRARNTMTEKQIRQEFDMEWDSFREFWKDHGREAFTNWLHGRESTEE